MMTNKVLGMEFHIYNHLCNEIPEKKVFQMPKVFKIHEYSYIILLQ